MEAIELARWTPWRVIVEKPEPTVDWVDLSATRFEEPFFAETLLRLNAAGGLDGSVRTTLSALATVEQVAPGRDPDGFIFHTARCGSTLVSRLAAQLPDVAVLSEADALNNLLELAPETVNPEIQLACIRLLLRAIGRGRGNAGGFLVKCSSWNVTRLPLIRAAFPNARFCFVYRDPSQIIASLLKTPAAWMRLREAPGQAEAVLGISANEIAAADEAGFASRALGEFFRHILEGDEGSGLLVDYSELPFAIWSRILPFFGRICTDAEIATLEEAAQWDAKQPSQRFSIEAAHKEIPLPASHIAQLVDTLAPLYQILEQRRNGPLPYTEPSRLQDSP